MNKALRSAIITATAVVGLDQAAKVAAMRVFSDGHVYDVIPAFFTLRYVLNEGAAWGILHGQRWLLSLVSIAMLVLLYFNRKELMSSRLTNFAGALLSGGIIGNLIDRLFSGRVVDFLDFHWAETYHFPTFNIADSAICVGVGLLLISSLPCFRTEQSSS